MTFSIQGFIDGEWQTLESLSTTDEAAVTNAWKKHAHTETNVRVVCY